MDSNVERIIKMLDESLNDRKMAVENFGNIAFAKKNIDGKTLKYLAQKYKEAYQKWIDVLSEVTNEVCDAWDDHCDPVKKFLATATPEQLDALQLVRK